MHVICGMHLCACIPVCVWYMFAQVMYWCALHGWQLTWYIYCVFAVITAEIVVRNTVGAYWLYMCSFSTGVKPWFQFSIVADEHAIQIWCMKRARACLWLSSWKSATESWFCNQFLAIVANTLFFFSTTPLKLYWWHQPILEGNNFNIIIYREIRMQAVNWNSAPYA